LEWRDIQEAMLRDYLHVAQDVLEVSTLFTLFFFKKKKDTLKILCHGVKIFFDRTNIFVLRLNNLNYHNINCILFRNAIILKLRFIFMFNIYLY